MALNPALIAQILGGVTGNPGLGTLAGNAISSFFSDSNARQVNALANTDANFARHLARRKLQVSEAARARGDAISDRILYQTGGMRDALSATLERLGARPAVDEDAVNRAYRKIAAGNRANVFELLDHVESTGLADNIREGMQHSTKNYDEQSARVRRFAPLLQQADSEAYKAALERSGGLADLINADRQGAFDEITAARKAPIDAELNLYARTPGWGADGALATTNALASIGSTESAERASGSDYTNLLNQGTAFIADYFRGRKPVTNSRNPPRTPVRGPGYGQGNWIGELS